MKQERIALKTMGMKAKLANYIRTRLYKCTEDEYSAKLMKDYKLITEKDKIEIFDEIFSLNKEMHKELNAYKAKRRYKAEIHRLREEKKKDLVNQK